MPLVVGVTFRRVGKVYYFDPGEIELHEGDFVIAETARGVEFGEVVLEPRGVPDEELVAPLKRVLRLANGGDLEREAANRDKEKHAYEVCERKIVEHGLAMKLLEAECAFDGSQITFSFSAEGRIDFRELVKDVAGALKTKVQLHQIGVRDEAKLIGGYGGCGRPLCCATFLSNFEPISMKMAKDQSLFLNPAKFSGCCGKLMCCLRYEHEHYKDSQRRLPAVGAIVQLEQGRARVIDVNVINNMLTLETEEEVQIHVPASQLKLEGICRRHGIACNMTEKNCQALLADPDAVPFDEDDNGDEEIVDEAPEDLVEDVLGRFVARTNEPVAPRPAGSSVTGVVWREPSPSPPSQAMTQGEEHKKKDNSGPGQGSRSRGNRNNQQRGNGNGGGRPRNRSNGGHNNHNNRAKPRRKPDGDTGQGS
ncbi:MAG: stage 0 sporulation family protein [Armatimonadetes bacterium]|nr:stage 0 sporulation family protein [Armatimonadota bacterium]